MKANPGKFHLLLSATGCQGTYDCNERTKKYKD